MVGQSSFANFVSPIGGSPRWHCSHLICAGEFNPDVIHFVDPIWLCAQMIPLIQFWMPDVPLLASYHTNLASYATLYGFGWLSPTVLSLMVRYRPVARFGSSLGAELQTLTVVLSYSATSTRGVSSRFALRKAPRGCSSHRASTTFDCGLGCVDELLESPSSAQLTAFCDDSGCLHQYV